MSDEDGRGFGVRAARCADQARSTAERMAAALVQSHMSPVRVSARTCAAAPSSWPIPSTGRRAARYSEVSASRQRASDLRDVLNEVGIHGGGLPAVVAALAEAARLDGCDDGLVDLADEADAQRAAERFILGAFGRQCVP